MATIALQIGHWKSKKWGPGAPYELDTLLQIAPHVLKKLEDAGVNVDLYGGDLPSGLKQDVFLSLHCDSWAQNSTGYSIGYWEELHPGSSILAKAIKDRYGRVAGLPWKGYNITVGEHHYYGFRKFQKNTKVALIELGFVSNPKERAYLVNNAAKLGKAVALGVLDYLQIKEVGEEKKEEIDMDVMQFNNTTKAERVDCWKDKCNYFVTTDGETSDLIFKLEGHKPLGGEGATAPQSVSKQQTHNIQDILKQAVMKDIKGSFKLTVECRSPINISIREVPK